MKKKKPKVKKPMYDGSGWSPMASCGGSGCEAPHEKILPKFIKIVKQAA